MSYTRFRYSNLKLSSPSVRADGAVQVSFNLKNVGDREGSDVAQLYTHQAHSATYQPIQSLRTFERVELKPGENRHLVFTLPASQLAYYDVQTKGFRMEPGTLDIWVGAASDDIRLRGHLEVR